jgi:hypothetical protein
MKEAWSMKKMSICEPAMCCGTGLCGVGVAPELLRISTVLNTLNQAGTGNRMLAAKANNEIKWINRVDEHSRGQFAVIGWTADEMDPGKTLY